MGLFQAKTRVIQAAAAALALFALPAYPNSTIRAPASQADQQARPASENTAMAQADAFTTAGEQAAFVGAYQMYFGPYGQITDDNERKKLIRETAAAIDDCINGRDCSDTKKEKVLKALMQYNMGQDVKRMMLTNNTNKEAMRSIDNSADARGQAVLNQAEIEKALSRGKDFSVDQSDPIKPYQSGKAADLTRATGTTKDPYYQLDEMEVTHKIDDEYLREREILGEKFLKDYAAFLDDFSAADDRISKRFYKYVPAKADGKVHVYDGQGSIHNCRPGAEGWCRENESLTVNQERMREVQIDQQNKKVRDAISDYRKNLTAMQGYRGDDGKVHVTKDGSHPSELGFGDTAEFDPAQFPDVNFNDLMENGKITPANRSRAIARVVNQQFKRTAAEAEKERPNERSLASKPNSNPNWIHNITLSPESFDQFLDEIWPTAIKRKEILSRAPANTEPTKEPEPEEAPRDKYGRQIRGDQIQPTIQRLPARQ